MTILEDVDLNFNLPIKYLDSKKIYEINEQMADDLELQTYKNTSLYKKILNPKTKIGDTIIPLWSKFYTDDVKYLNDTKTILKTHNNKQFLVEKNDKVVDNFI